MPSFSYDGAGNVTADTRGSTTYNYVYNKRNRLAELTIGSTVTADYTYDGLERLAIRTTSNMTPAGTTQYVYDLAGHLIAEADSSGNTLTEYVWLDDMPLAVVANVDISSPNLYFVHSDHLNRPIRMTDTTESVVWDAVYNPFGDIYSISGSATNNMRFPGQYFLIEDGLHYNWYRHYDPTISRYIQPDPRGFINGPSQYAYVNSNSIKLIDPQGQFWIPAAVIGIALIITEVQTFIYNTHTVDLPPKPRPIPKQHPPKQACNLDFPTGDAGFYWENPAPVVPTPWPWQAPPDLDPPIILPEPTREPIIPY